jgi:membrane associated rhomboid family serine protease
LYGRGQQAGVGVPGLTPGVKGILIANVVVFVIQMLTPGFSWWFAVSVEGVLSGMLWQPFTYMWLHAGLAHILFNMLAVWMFGSVLEQAWGTKRFIRYYLICGTGAGLIILLWNSLVMEPYVPTLGASGAIYGVLTAFSLLWPDRTIMLIFPPIPLKAIWFIPLLFVLTLATSNGNVSHAGHLGGVLVGAWLMRSQLHGYFNVRSISHRWHRYRMRNRLRAVRRDEWERRKKQDDDDDQDRPTYH